VPINPVIQLEYGPIARAEKDRQEAAMRANSQSGGGFGNALRVLVFSLMTVSALGQEVRKPIARPAPAYPEVAKRIALSGTVKVQVVIGTDGQVKEVKIVGGHPLFVDATLEALKKWKYAPSNTETTATLEFSFHP
jgi:TonB family protein